MNLLPFIELAKQITDSQLCEIDIIDSDYQRTLEHNATDLMVAPLRNILCYETIRKNGIYEIDDFSKKKRYKNLSFVNEMPWLRYYLGIKLTTSAGKDIGTIMVADPVPKRISKEQKVQFKNLAHSVMMTIESEFNHRTISGQLDALKDSMHKLNHDVTSPINGIILMADLLIEDIERVDVQAFDIKMIREAAQSLGEIITGVLKTEDENKNKEELLEREPISEVLEKIKGLYNPLAQIKNVTLSLTNHVESKIRAPYFFSVKLLRIIGNLVSNAIKFTPENGSVDVIFNGNSNLNQSILNITVSNTGKSMSAEQITSFNNGFPVARSNNSGGEIGFGTGLQHVYRMISEEEGSVTIEARKGSGTRFSISLPLPPDEIYIDLEGGPVSFDLNGFQKPAVNGTKH